MKRRHDDSVKPGRGIDDDLGSDYTKRYVTPMDDPSIYPDQRRKETSHPGAYTSNDSGLTRTDDFEHGSASRQIWQDVEDNQRPGGEYDSTGAIKSGVNRSQKQ